MSFFFGFGTLDKGFFFLELEYPAGVFNHVFLPFWVFVRFQHDRSVFGCDLSRAWKINFWGVWGVVVGQHSLILRALWCMAGGLIVKKSPEKGAVSSSRGSRNSSKHRWAKWRNTAVTLTSSLTDVRTRRQPKARASRSASSLVTDDRIYRPFTIFLDLLLHFCILKWH